MNPHGTTAPVENLSEEAREMFNRQFDEREREKRQAGHVIGPPGLSNLKDSLSDDELNKIVWRWHGSQI